MNTLVVLTIYAILWTLALELGVVVDMLAEPLP